jgi:hypothetical protein
MNPSKCAPFIRGSKQLNPVRTAIIRQLPNLRPNRGLTAVKLSDYPVSVGDEKMITRTSSVLSRTNWTILFVSWFTAAKSTRRVTRHSGRLLAVGATLPPPIRWKLSRRQ